MTFTGFSPADGIRWPSARSKEWLARFLRRASQDDDILAVVAIGSSVRPVAQSADLDLLVVRRGEATKSPPAPIEVDIREYEAGRVESMITGGHDLLGWAVRFGVPLYERQTYWTDLVRDFEHRLPLPSAELAKTRAARTRSFVEDLIAAGDEDAAAEQLVSYLTHIARAALIEASVFPTSRPELPDQLRSIDEFELAELLEAAIHRERSAQEIYASFRRLRPTYSA